MSGLVRIDDETAEKYVRCILGDNDLGAFANDGLRRMVHDTIARRLKVGTQLIKRAAYIVERLFFFKENVFRDWDTPELTRLFKKHCDDIYYAQLNDSLDETALIATWTYDALHPNEVKYYE